MKVSVITRHAITNYGSLLQAFATQKIIENCGNECEIIDYVRQDESYVNHEKTLLNNKPSWNNSFVKRALYLVLRQPESILAGRKFDRERKKYLKLSQCYNTRESLKQMDLSSDVYMTGSDQVWGRTEDRSYDDNYCLSFVNNKKKIAYAASFGHTEFDEETKQYFTKWLSQYDHITVRESSAVEIIREMDLDCQQVLDPTLLFDDTFWKKYSTYSGKRKYVLVYQLHNDNKLSEYAQKVADDLGLPLIRISASLHQFIRKGKFVWCPTISDFLGYIQNAEIMITDSFHGTAFAINFNTPFVEVMPNNNTGTRNMSILRLTRLENRILTENNEMIYKSGMDFSYANEILKKEREKSISILNKMIVG